MVCEIELVSYMIEQYIDRVEFRGLTVIDNLEYNKPDIHWQGQGKKGKGHTQEHDGELCFFALDSFTLKPVGVSL